MPGAEHDIIRRLETGPSASTVDLVTELGLPWSEVEAGLATLRQSGLVEQTMRDGHPVHRLAASKADLASVLSV
jgi:DNA-binding IclR family transcriptional regulator